MPDTPPNAQDLSGLRQDDELTRLRRRIEKLEEMASLDRVIVMGGFISSASVANNGYYPVMINGKTGRLTMG